MIKKEFFLAVTLPICLGVLTGVMFGSDRYFRTKAVYTNESGQSLTLSVDQQLGQSDKKSTRDTAIGLLVKSDNVSKGTHKLIRGSDALTVFLISSVLDLSQFEGRGVQIWGETIQNKNVGWFMDVVKLKIIK